ncbi:MAG: HAD-IA family hydrolase [Candidatus Acidiferrales bacterium]
MALMEGPTRRDGIRSVIFDFDFTLADTSNGIFDCVSTALAAVGATAAERDAVNATIGLPLRDAYTKLTGNADENRQSQFVEHFHRRADDIMVKSAVVFEFVPEAIRQIRAQGLTTAVASTKRRVHIESILERESLTGAFDAVVGGNDVQNQKPHPESLFAGMRKLGAAPWECVYVGDSIVDAEAANRAGIQFVAVLSGVTPRAQFDSYPVCEILNHVGEIPAWLEIARNR